jgi:broad specificity phosphatase PhoE
MRPALREVEGPALSEVEGPMAAVQYAYLIRHGETAWSRSGQHTGTTDIPLTDLGQRVARDLEPILARETFALVLSSPLERAKQTSVLAGFGERVAIDRDLAEWDYGEYEGLTTGEIRMKAPDWTIFNDGCPGGESPDQVRARADRVIARIRSTEGHVALFAHGHLLRVLVARWLGLPTSAGSWFLLDTATVSVLSYYRGTPAIKQWNTGVDVR